VLVEASFVVAIRAYEVPVLLDETCELSVDRREKKLNQLEDLNTWCFLVTEPKRNQGSHTEED
jgi:hypothetical protein